MATTITTVLDDDTLSELQSNLGTSEANVPSMISSHAAYIESSKAIKSLPGYNNVEIVLPIDAVALLVELGYLSKE